VQQRGSCVPRIFKRRWLYERHFAVGRVGQERLVRRERQRLVRRERQRLVRRERQRLVRRERWLGHDEWLGRRLWVRFG
jgi:hypothetical protein